MDRGTALSLDSPEVKAVGAEFERNRAHARFSKFHFRFAELFEIFFHTGATRREIAQRYGTKPQTITAVYNRYFLPLSGETLTTRAARRLEHERAELYECAIGELRRHTTVAFVLEKAQAARCSIEFVPGRTHNSPHVQGRELIVNGERMQWQHARSAFVKDGRAYARFLLNRHTLGRFSRKILCSCVAGYQWRVDVVPCEDLERLFFVPWGSPFRQIYRRLDDNPSRHPTIAPLLSPLVYENAWPKRGVAEAA